MWFANTGKLSVSLCLFSAVLNLCLPCVQPEQITRRRWLRFLPFWPSRRRLPINLLFLKGPVLPAPGPQGRTPRPSAAPAPHRPGLPGAHDRGGLQLPPRQQLCPLLPSHAALHQRASANMKSSWISTNCFAKDSIDTCECFCFAPSPEATNSSPAGELHALWSGSEVMTISLTNIAHRLTWSHLSPLKPALQTKRTFVWRPSSPSPNISRCFNLNVYIIFKVFEEIWNEWKTKHYLYTVYWEPKSTMLFVHDIQCCYYLFNVQSIVSLLVLMKLSATLNVGMLYP